MGRRPLLSGYILAALVVVAAPRWTLGLTFNIPDGDVSALKSAINTANGNGGDDTIELASNGIYILTSVDHFLFGLPAVAADGGHQLFFHANSATIQCQAPDEATPFGVFDVNSGAIVTITALTIEDGSADTAFCAGGGTLSFNSCVFLNNTSEDAGVVTTYGSITVTNTVFSGNRGVFGGTIGCFGGDITVDGCTFSGNSAGSGGAIYVNADRYAPDTASAVIRNSTFILNSANDDGGAIWVEAYHNIASLTIENSTFDRNSVLHAEGISGVGGALRIRASGFAIVNTVLTNCTLTGNAAYEGGGIYDDSHGDGDSFSSIRMVNCTLSGNTAFLGAAYYDEAPSDASVFSVGNTIFQANNSGPAFWGAQGASLGHNICSDSANGFLSDPNDQINTDAKLDPNGLQDNGGPTKTIALHPDSPAINNGNGNLAPHRDQRGYFRNGRADIGAFEFQGGLVGAFTQITRTGVDITPACEVVAGHTYHLKRKLNLTDVSWQDISSVSDLTATGDTITFTDPNPTSDGHRFYQVSLVQ